MHGVIGLARSFGYRVIAEGVETIEQGQMLLQLGCTQAQGYCIARPMPLAAPKSHANAIATTRTIAPATQARSRFMTEASSIDGPAMREVSRATRRDPNAAAG